MASDLSTCQPVIELTHKEEAQFTTHTGGVTSVPSGVTGRVVECIPAACGRWLGTPLSELSEGPYMSNWECETLLKGASVTQL